MEHAHRTTWLSSRLIRLWMLCLLSAGPAGLAQQVIQIQPLGRANPRDAEAPAEAGSASLRESTPINDLFKRAREGIDRRDWKFVVDSLQRIIEDPQGALLTTDDQVYESARRQAYRQLAALPPEGLSAYHLLYDAEAETLYQAAVSAHDIAGLRKVIDYYLLTEAGDDAVTTLAAWLIDRGDPAAAIAPLYDLRELNPASQRAATTAAGQLAVAYAQLGWLDKAQTLLQDLRATPDLPAGWRQRGEQLAAFLADYQPEHLERPSERWSMRGGGPTRRGMMPATMPSFLDGLPWRYELPSATPVPWNEVIQLEADTQMLLVSQMVTDDNLLFVKSNGTIIAIDQISFEVLWTSQAPALPVYGDAPRVRFNAWQINQPRQTPRLQVPALLLDHLSAELSTAAGKVFEIQRPEPSEEDLALQAGNANIRIIIGPNNDEIAPSNRLVAHDIAAGRVAWSRGMTGDHEDPLAMVTFAAAPVAIGDDLLVPYRQDKDLFAAILSPADGKLLDSAHLCTLPDAGTLVEDPLPPAVDEQMAYIPTNAGLLLAFHTADHTLRWASRYPRRPLPTPVRGRPVPPDTRDRWLPAPPMISGATVILAPGDSNELVAFDRGTGVMQWKIPRKDHRYVIAAGQGSVWLAGPRFTRVSLADGRLMWQTQVGATTGRAVVSGDRILVPTEAGLLVMDAATGQTIELQALPENDDHMPLGNLLCWGGALYSLDSEQLRKFPDLQQSYDAAVQLHRSNPADAAAAIRLAWMELLKGDPDQALAVLAADFAGADERQRRQMIHLQVRSRIASAEQPGQDPEQARAHLEKAVELANSQQDRFVAGLALARRMAAADEQVNAYRSLWAMLHTDEADFETRSDNGQKRSAHSVLRGRLGELRAAMTAEQLTELTAVLEPQVHLDTPADRGDRRRRREHLDRLAEGDALNDWNQVAALTLGRWAIDARRYEEAEYYLTRAADCGQRSGLAAEALHLLAGMYLHPDLSAFHLASEALRRLEAEFPGEVLAGGQAVSAVVAALGADVARGRAEMRARFTPSSSSMMVTDIADGALLHRAGSERTPEEDLALIFEEPNLLSAWRPSNGRQLWKAELRLLEESSIPPPVDPYAQRNLPRTEAPIIFHQARVDGQVLLVNTEHALHAVGLLTGRRLWAEPLDAPRPAEDNIATARSFDMAGGRVALRRHAHRLEVRRTLDGRLLWQVHVPEHSIDAVRLVGQRVVAMDDQGRHASVFDLEDGRHLFSREFASATAEQLHTPMAVVARGVLFGVGGAEAVAYRLEDGETLFNVPLSLKPSAVFAAGDDCWVIGGMQGGLLVLDNNGGVRYEGVLEFAETGVTGGHLEGSTLLLAGRGTGHEWREVQMAALDLTDGTPRWVQTGLGLPQSNPQWFTMLPDRIPLIYQMTPIELRSKPVFVKDLPSQLVFLDKATGRPAGDTVPIPLGPANNTSGARRLTGEILCWPHRVLLGTNTALGPNGVIMIPLTIAGSAVAPQGPGDAPSARLLGRL